MSFTSLSNSSVVDAKQLVLQLAARVEAARPVIDSSDEIQKAQAKAALEKELLDEWQSVRLALKTGKARVPRILASAYEELDLVCKGRAPFNISNVTENDPRIGTFLPIEYVGNTPVPTDLLSKQRGWWRQGTAHEERGAHESVQPSAGQSKKRGRSVQAVETSKALTNTSDQAVELKDAPPAKRPRRLEPRGEVIATSEEPMQSSDDDDRGVQTIDRTQCPSTRGNKGKERATDLTPEGVAKTPWVRLSMTTTTTTTPVATPKVLTSALKSTASRSDAQSASTKRVERQVTVVEEGEERSPVPCESCLKRKIPCVYGSSGVARCMGCAPPNKYRCSLVPCNIVTGKSYRSTRAGELAAGWRIIVAKRIARGQPYPTRAIYIPASGKFVMDLNTLDNWAGRVGEGIRQSGAARIKEQSIDEVVRVKREDGGAAEDTGVESIQSDVDGTMQVEPGVEMPSVAEDLVDDRALTSATGVSVDYISSSEDEDPDVDMIVAPRTRMYNRLQEKSHGMPAATHRPMSEVRATAPPMSSKSVDRPAPNGLGGSARMELGKTTTHSGAGPSSQNGNRTNNYTAIPPLPRRLSIKTEPLPSSLPALPSAKSPPLRVSPFLSSHSHRVAPLQAPSTSAVASPSLHDSQVRLQGAEAKGPRSGSLATANGQRDALQQALQSERRLREELEGRLEETRNALSKQTRTMEIIQNEVESLRTLVAKSVQARESSDARRREALNALCEQMKTEMEGQKDVWRRALRAVAMGCEAGLNVLRDNAATETKDANAPGSSTDLRHRT